MPAFVAVKGPIFAVPLMYLLASNRATQVPTMFSRMPGTRRRSRSMLMLGFLTIAASTRASDGPGVPAGVLTRWRAGVARLLAACCCRVVPVR